MAQGLVAEASQPLMQTHKGASDPCFVPGSEGAFHANLQATSDVSLYLSHALVSLLPCKLRTPRENISESTRERGKEHILRVVRLTVCATDGTEAV